MEARLRTNCEKLFDVFVELIKPIDETEPQVIQIFPPDYPETQILKSIPGFAYPCTNVSSLVPTVEHHTFIITDIENKISFGYCRMTSSCTSCIVILSPFPWFSIFQTILNSIGDLLLRDENSVICLLEKLYDHPLPKLSDIFVVRHQSSITNQLYTISFEVPSSLQMSSVLNDCNVCELYCRLEPEALISMFTSLLLERRILFVGKTMSRVSRCVLAAASLLYPMVWYGLLIPVLPCPLNALAGCPTPFLIGVLSSYVDEVKEWLPEPDRDIIINLDDGTIHNPNSDLEQFPSDWLRNFRHQLEASIKKFDQQMFPGAFLDALVHLIGSYRCGFVTTQDSVDFDFDKFLPSCPENMHEILKALKNTLWFSEFISNRLEMLTNSQQYEFDAFDQRVSELIDRADHSKSKEIWSQVKRFRQKGTSKWHSTSYFMRQKTLTTIKNFSSKAVQGKNGADHIVKYVKQSERSPSPEVTLRHKQFNRLNIPRPMSQPTFSKSPLTKNTTTYTVLCESDSKLVDTDPEEEGKTNPAAIKKRSSFMNDFDPSIDINSLFSKISDVYSYIPIVPEQEQDQIPEPPPIVPPRTKRLVARRSRSPVASTNNNVKPTEDDEKELDLINLKNMEVNLDFFDPLSSSKPKVDNGDFVTVGAAQNLSPVQPATSENLATGDLLHDWSNLATLNIGNITPQSKSPVFFLNDSK